MRKKADKQTIGVLGLWHLGLVYSASLAKLGFTVTGFDFDNKTIDNLNKSRSSIYEPGLKEVIRKYLNLNLFFSHKPQEAIKNKDYVFICLDVPVDNNDQINLSPFFKIINLLFKHCSPKTTIILSSQVPVGTSRSLLLKLKSRHPGVNLIYFPENLRLGKGIETFLHPDRIVLGSSNNKICRKFIKTFSYFDCPILTMSLESAEMVKHALNSFLALNISFSSEIGDLCEMVGANLNDVIAALKTDKRVSCYAPINPGLGFSGGTLGRDLQSLTKISHKNNYNPFLLKAVYKVNQRRLDILLKKIEKIFPSLQRKNIGILGLTYKPETSTLRRSLSLNLAELLYERKTNIKAFDPSVKKKIKTYPYIDIARSINDFFMDLDIFILMTDWPDFKKINPYKILPFMKKGVIFDTKNFLDQRKYTACGFTYYGIGYHV